MLWKIKHSRKTLWQAELETDVMKDRVIDRCYESKRVIDRCYKRMRVIDRG